MMHLLVTHAVDLPVPDFPGAVDGSNPFHIWPDACKYGVGAGLFQGFPKEHAQMPGTHYHLMGLPVWCTKAEVVAWYGELRRLRTSHGAVPMEALDEACAVLGDVDRRAKYDAELGMQSR